MFSPVKIPIKAYENITLEKVIRFRDKFDNIIPLSGYTARIDIRLDALDDTPEGIILSLTTENGGITIDEDLGKITIYIETPILKYAGVYDMILFKDSKTFYPILTSPFKVVPTVTGIS